MLTNDVWSYTWDAENRLVAAYSNTVCVVSNAYDYMSRRVLKVTPEALHTFVYDGWNVVAELTHTQTHTLTNLYVWGKDLSGNSPFSKERKDSFQVEGGTSNSQDGREPRKRRARRSRPTPKSPPNGESTR